MSSPNFLCHDFSFHMSCLLPYVKILDSFLHHLSHLRKTVNCMAWVVFVYFVCFQYLDLHLMHRLNFIKRQIFFTVMSSLRYKDVVWSFLSHGPLNSRQNILITFLLAIKLITYVEFILTCLLSVDWSFFPLIFAFIYLFIQLTKINSSAYHLQHWTFLLSWNWIYIFLDYIIQHHSLFVEFLKSHSKCSVI